MCFQLLQTQNFSTSSYRLIDWLIDLLIGWLMDWLVLWITSLSRPVTKPGSVRGWAAPRLQLWSRASGCRPTEARCDIRSRTGCCSRIRTSDVVPESRYKEPDARPPRTASRRAPAQAPPPSWAQEARRPTPASYPASASCICTSCSETRSWPAWMWVWGGAPGALSPDRTGSAGVWSASPAQTPAPGRIGPGAFCVACLQFLCFRYSQVN